MDEITQIKNDELGNNNSSNIPNSNLDAESEYVYLPSQGIYYSEPYKGLEKLKVRKLNWEDEDILTTESYYKNGTLFDEILKNCIIDDNKFPASMLVPVDRDTILWWLRIGAFGRMYKLPWKCTNEDCKKSFDVEWDLGSFKAPTPPEHYEEELVNTGGIIITLPLSGLKCKISVSSTGREKEIDKKLKNKKEKTKSSRDFLSTAKLISVIREAYLDGEVLKGSEDILKWLKTGYNGKPIPLTDSRYIFLKAKEISLNIDTKQDLTCPHCDHTQEGVSMPMSIHFFWPEYQELS